MIRRRGNGEGPRKGEDPKCEKFKDLGRKGYLNMCGMTGYSCERAQKEGMCIKKPVLCVYCNKPIKTEKSKVTTFDDGSMPYKKGTESAVATGFAHRGCALKNGAEEI